MKRLFLFVYFLITSQILFAQEGIPQSDRMESNKPEILTHLNLNQDPRLNKMISWHIEKNKKFDGIEGYRVEIYFSSNVNAKENALRKKVEFLSQYPDNTVHIKYDAPNFRVRVGDFRTKNEALKLYKEIKSKYPVAFIVADKIDFPLLKYKQYE